MFADEMNRSEMNEYFNDLSKEIKKTLGRNARIELIVVGGAAIALNYDFRDSTTDIDAYVSSGESIKDAIRRVADKHGISEEWLNDDFKRTTSYSPILTRTSNFYKTFNQVLSIRTVASEYLIAMKLKSFGPYKHDRSDITGIIAAEPSMTIERIEKAVSDLYGSWDEIPKEARDALEGYLRGANSYDEVAKEEHMNKQLIDEFHQQYPGRIKGVTPQELIDIIKAKKGIK